MEWTFEQDKFDVALMGFGEVTTSEESQLEELRLR